MKDSKVGKGCTSTGAKGDVVLPVSESLDESLRYQ